MDSEAPFGGKGARSCRTSTRSPGTRGRLPCPKVGRSWRIRRGSLEEFFRRSERPVALVWQLASFITAPDNILVIPEDRESVHRLDAASGSGAPDLRGVPAHRRRDEPSRRVLGRATQAAGRRGRRRTHDLGHLRRDEGSGFRNRTRTAARPRRASRRGASGGQNGPAGRARRRVAEDSASGAVHALSEGIPVEVRPRPRSLGAVTEGLALGKVLPPRIVNATWRIPIRFTSNVLDVPETNRSLR